jgi:DNA-binding response OmpR family regulator
MLPIIFVSANSTEQNIVQGLTQGANDFVRKPLNQAELMARVSRHLDLNDTLKDEIARETNNNRIIQVRNLN